jgi:S-adenosyl-L-methionine hydrolase (adenosine-forming)
MPSRLRTRPPIALLTDFGYRDHYAGVMRGVIAKIAPAARIIDITHGVPPQSIMAGALALRESWRYFPAGTIFVVVVDPGVGTARTPIAIETRAGAIFVGPDNGVLWLAASAAKIRSVVKLTSARYRLPAVSNTFHGRDIFAPAGAHLWRGIRLKDLGPRITTVEQLDLGVPTRNTRALEGRIVYVDGFGNLVSNIDRGSVARLNASFPARGLWVTIKRSAPMKILDAYADAPKGAPLATFGSFDLLEVAVRDGDAARRFKAGVGSPVIVAARPG